MTICNFECAFEYIKQLSESSIVIEGMLSKGGLPNSMKLESLLDASRDAYNGLDFI